MRGPWRSVLYLSSIVVSAIARVFPLVPWPINRSREHLHVLQARKSVQADDVIYLWFQSKPISPLDNHIFRRGICDRSDVDVCHRDRDKIGYETLEELGRHA